jgi:alpha-L-rhamnosidase
LPANRYRTRTDFGVGSNMLACTIDGTKRDRTTFAGNLYVMARSIYYSTSRTDAILGSLLLLSSHQSAEGYLENLCPVQAPIHKDNHQPPTYAFYSLSYSLLLVTTTKDYWWHTETRNSFAAFGLSWKDSYNSRENSLMGAALS